MTVLLWSAGVILLVFLAGGFITFYCACRRTQEIDWLDRAAVEATPYAPFYDHMVEADQWLILHKAQQLQITSKDGLLLYGLWVPAKDAKGTVIMAHGYRSCFLADYGLVLDFYHSHGMNILLPDQRCHGQSQGKYITFGVKESDDFLEWLSYHNTTFGPYPVILSGLSMGASTVMYLADRELPENVRGIIADCGFTSPAEIICHVFRKAIHITPRPFLWSADLFARLMAGFSLFEKDSRRTLARSRLPLLMVHGTADDFVPCDMTLQAYAAALCEKTLFLVEGAGHGVSFLEDRQGYTRKVIEFLEEHIPYFTG